MDSIFYNPYHVGQPFSTKTVGSFLNLWAGVHAARQMEEAAMFSLDKMGPGGYVYDMIYPLCPH